MGLDGGCITRRPDMIKKPDKSKRVRTERERKETNAENYWVYCALTGLPLKAPILISKCGAIFNKEDVLQAILEKNLPKKLRYLKHLKNTKELDLRGVQTLLEYSCPLSGKIPNPSTKNIFTFIFSCGHLFDQEAFNIMCNDGTCPICGNKFSKEDLVVLNGYEDHEYTEK